MGWSGWLGWGLWLISNVWHGWGEVRKERRELVGEYPKSTAWCIWPIGRKQTFCSPQVYEFLRVTFMYGPPDHMHTSVTLCSSEGCPVWALSTRCCEGRTQCCAAGWGWGLRLCGCKVWFQHVDSTGWGCYPRVGKARCGSGNRGLGGRTQGSPYPGPRHGADSGPQIPVLEEGLVTSLSPRVRGWFRVARIVPRGPHRKALWPEPAQADQEACCRTAWLAGHWPAGTALRQWTLRAIHGTVRTPAAAAQSWIWEGNKPKAPHDLSFIKHLLATYYVTSLRVHSWKT